jgi:hypothetical protein
MRFKGYLEAVPWGKFAPGESKVVDPSQVENNGLAFCGAEVVKLSHEDQVERAQAVDEGEAEPYDVGSFGTSIFVRMLDYFDYRYGFMNGIGHTGPYGCVKSFWRCVLKGGKGKVKGFKTPGLHVPNHVQKLMSARAAEIHATSDFNRPYSDIVAYGGIWTMEDYLHWTETWSTYILKDIAVNEPVLKPVVATMWKLLRNAMLYFTRHDPLPGVPDNLAEAQGMMWEYSRLVEEHCHPQMCTFLLHIMNCQMPDQEKAHGKVCKNSEYYIEHQVQDIKGVLHGRGITDPWIVYANTALESEGVNKTRWSHNVKSFDEHVPEFRSQQHKGKNLDDGDEEGNQCLGSGREVTAEEERRDVLRVLRLVIAKFHDDIPRGWSELGEEIVTTSLLEYSRAHAGGREVVHSASYQRESKRISSNVLVRYDERGTHAEYVCKVQRFIKASAVGCPPIRFAIGDLHRLETVSKDFGTLWMAEDFTNPDHEGYGVMLGHMLWKLVTCKPRAGNSAWFMSYSIQSGL